MTTLVHPAPPSATAGARPFPPIDLPSGPPPQAAPALAPAEPAPRKTGWLAWLLAGTAVAGVLGVMGFGVATVLLRSSHPAQPPGDWVGMPQPVSPQQPTGQPPQPSQPAPAPLPTPNAPASVGTVPQAPTAAAVPVPAPTSTPRSGADDLRALKRPGPYAPPASARPAPAPAPAASAASPTPQEPAANPSAAGQPEARAASEAVPKADPASVAGTPIPDPADAPAPQALVKMVAALADDIAQERRSDADTRQQIAGLLRDTDQRLSEFGRRLAVVEAKPFPALSRVGSGRASAGTLSAMRVAVSAAPPPGGRSYEIRAASPGVAVLGTLDGTPAVVEIAVGDQVPGWGRVNAIAQAGRAWAVLCEHGTIQ